MSKLNIIFSCYHLLSDSHQLHFAASERVSGNTQVSLVSRARNIWSRDVHSSEGAQGDVRGQDYEEQDHQLRTQVLTSTTGWTTHTNHWDIFVVHPVYKCLKSLTINFSVSTLLFPVR